MPTSNQTDTNNNSNNKITNGRSAVVEVVVSDITDLPTATMILPSEGTITSSGAGGVVAGLVATQLVATTTVAAATATGTTATQPSSDLISAIKQHEHSQHHQSTINNNNNSVINNNKINSSTNGVSNHNSNSRTTTTTTTKEAALLSNGNVAAAAATVASSRTLDELSELIRDLNFDRTLLSNEELIRLVKNNQVSIYKLESFLGKDNAARCVEVRRDYYRLVLAELDKIDQIGITDRADAFNHPRYEDLNYERVNGACCENVIGHVKVPVGLAGPLVLDGEEIFVPLATTEGCLVASTCRGLSALRKSGGVSSRVRRDFMTRAPIIRFQDIKLRDALDNVERAILWLNDKNNKEKMRAAFNLTSSHGKFLNYTMYPVNREIHIRFEAQTGDAMGMNMCSKGVESALKEMQRAFPTMEIVTLSGNMCTDKKAAGINWINGRGKSVECNAELPAQVVQQVFKVTVDQLVDRWKSKVMIGSALAASIGGFNSQAANILTAIFIATGQDPAQNVTSSNCMLILEKDSKGSLVVCCTMPSIECGTVGGGTILGDQSRYLQMMGVRGPTPKSASRQQQKFRNINNGLYNNSGEPQQQEANSSAADSSTTIPSSAITNTNEYTNARKLARIICATVMAGELSLLAALTEGTLVKSHMRHNRSSTNVLTTGSNSLIGGGFGGGGGGGGLIGSGGGQHNHHHHHHFHHNNHQHNNQYQSVCSGPTKTTMMINNHEPFNSSSINMFSSSSSSSSNSIMNHTTVLNHNHYLNSHFIDSNNSNSNHHLIDDNNDMISNHENSSSSRSSFINYHASSANNPQYHNNHNNFNSNINNQHQHRLPNDLTEACGAGDSCGTTTCSGLC